MKLCMTLKNRSKRIPVSQQHQYIVERTHLFEYPYLLESPGNAVDRVFPRNYFFSSCSKDQYLAATYGHQPGEQINQSSLAGAVRTDQPCDFSLRNVQ